MANNPLALRMIISRYGVFARDILRRLAAVVLLVTLAFGAPEVVRAQQSGILLQVIPTAGWYEPIQNLRWIPGSDQENSRWTRLEPGPVFGLQLGVDLPIAVLDLRANFLYAPASDLAVRKRTGSVSCGPGCTNFSYDLQPLANASLFVVAGDLLIRGPHVWRLSPYALIGGGVKWYAFARDELAGAYLPAFPEDEITPTLQLGLGTDVRIGASHVLVEVANYLSRFETRTRRMIEETNGSTSVVEEVVNSYQIQNDLVFTIGLRLRMF